jgi:hypothetical protein
MSDQWAKVSFNVSNKVLGCDVEFHDGTTARLGPREIGKKIFHETRTGKDFDVQQMISNLLMKTNTRKQDLVKPAALAEAFEKGICFGKPDLHMTCTPGSISVSSKGKLRDVKRIVFDVELTVRPKKSS